MEGMTSWFATVFDRQPIMAILRGFGPDRTVELAHAAWNLGITCVEVPVQRDRDLESLAAAIEAGARRGRQVGAGTIISTELVAAVADAGAAFTVAPGLDIDVVRASHNAGMPHLPGVATATDIQSALLLGLRWLKAFPAARLGPGWIGDMRGPFPDVKFVATGGISAANAAEFLDGGANVVAVGSALADPEAMPELAAIIAARSNPVAR